MKPDMKVKLAGLELVNPVIAASGTFGKATKTGTVTFMVVVTDARKKTGTQGLSLTVDASP